MLYQTRVTLFGARVWLEAENKRALKSAEQKLYRWLDAHFGVLSGAHLEKKGNEKPLP